MFGGSDRKQKAAALAALKAIQGQIDAALKENTRLQQQVDQLQTRAYLIGIQREGQRNKFIFSRNMQIYTVETYSTLADAMDEWKKDLLA